MSKFADAIAAAAEIEDVNEAQAAGDFAPIAEGPVRVRFVGYIELGKHEKTWQGNTKLVDKARFIFEVSGPKLTPREDGLPHLISTDLTKSNSERASYYKLFRKMNHTGKHKVFAQMLGEGFRGTITHNKGKNDKVYANLTDKDGVWSITAPFYDDPETGERKEIAVPEAKAEERCLIWAFPDKAQWDSLFIDGEWEAQAASEGKEARPARSKNIHQLKVKEAKNFQGSPLQELLFGELDLGDAEKPERTEEAKEQTADAKAATAQARANAAAASDPLADDSIPW